MSPLAIAARPLAKAAPPESPRKRCTAARRVRTSSRSAMARETSMAHFVAQSEVARKDVGGMNQPVPLEMLGE